MSGEGAFWLLDRMWEMHSMEINTGVRISMSRLEGELEAELQKDLEDRREEM